MYVPEAFRVTELTTLWDFIEAHSFAVLVSHDGSQPYATHLPMLLDRTSGKLGTLIGHFARANPHWQITDRRALVIFSGPNAYISARWYEAPQVVPTWNYVAVHAAGTLTIEDDPHRQRAILDDYAKFYERGLSSPWTTAEDEEYVDRLTAAVVGFRLEIEQLEGKWKLGQNHKAERRESVIRALSAQPDAGSQAIAALMRETLESPPPHR